MENQKRRKRPESISNSQLHEGLKHLFIQMSERPISYFPIYSKITNSVTAGVLLAQIVYWGAKYKEFYKTDDEFCKEIAIGLYELKSAKTKLQKLGFVKIQRKGIPAKTYYTINLDEIIQCITRVGKNQEQELGKIHNLIKAKPRTKKTKTTSENTSESTNVLLHKIGVSSKHLTSINKIIFFWNNLPRTQKHSIPKTDEDKITKTYKTISLHIDNLLSGKPLVRNKDNFPSKPYKKFLTEYKIPFVLHTMTWIEKDIIDMLEIFSETQSAKSAKMSLSSVFWNNFAKIRGGGFSWFIHTAANTDLVD